MGGEFFISLWGALEKRENVAVVNVASRGDKKRENVALCVRLEGNK